LVLPEWSGRLSTPATHAGPREDYTTPLNPLGIKGAGESDIAGVAE